MKSLKECQSKLNELIAFADVETDQDHANLGAMLASTGVAFMITGGMTNDQIEWVVEQARRVINGGQLLPIPGSGRD